MGSPQARRFVVLHHVLSAGSHWDLMLERCDTLVTWQLAAPPEVAAAGPTVAQRIADHRKAYLDYEGPVSGGRGSVRIADAGTCRILVEAPDEWRFELAGRILRGTFRLARQPENADRWLLQSWA